jgi:recombining binding protein (suppressor of hairless)
MQTYEYDHAEGLVQEQPNYDLFPTSAAPGNSFASQRYRTNASSSSSLGPSYNMNAEPIYPHASFSDSVPQYSSSNGNPYDIINGMPSSYSSGKVSPLTPSDPVGHLPPVSAFASSSAGMNTAHKEFPRHGYSDLMQDRRLSGVSASSYQSEYPEEYPASSNLPYPTSAVPHFQDRLVRYPPDARFPHPSGSSPSVHPHVRPGHSSEMLRSVAPHATHSYRPDGSVNGYDDMSHYMGNHHGDIPPPMPAVDETMARMKLQGHSMMGPSNDLQTFIRFVTSVLL